MKLNIGRQMQSNANAILKRNPQTNKINLS